VIIPYEDAGYSKSSQELIMVEAICARSANMI
jgi:hypothetical protein